MLEIAEKIDWREIEETTSKLLSRLVGYDTSNPPGDTAEAADFLYETLASEGIFATLVPPEGGKRNLIAQLEGSGKQEPLLLLSPLDVVGADPSGWSEFKPFSGYDDGRYIWGRGTIAAKSLVAAQIMALILIKRAEVPLRRHIRFAAYADGFGTGEDGLSFLVEHHLPLIGAEHCLSWSFPPSTELGGKTAYFIHRSERAGLQLTIRAEGWDGALGRGDAARCLLKGINAIEDEFAGDFGTDENTDSMFKTLHLAAGGTPAAQALKNLKDTLKAEPVKPFPTSFPKLDKPVEAVTDKDLNAEALMKVDAGLLPRALVDYLNSLCRTGISVTRLDAGSHGSVGARTAETDIFIRPNPGSDQQECSSRVVAALERLGVEAPYVARAALVPGSVSEPDEEINRILLAACRSVSPEAELVEGISVYPTGLDALRQMGITVYGFHPLELPDGLDDASRRAFGCDERIAKFALGRLTRVMFEACVRFAS